MRNNKKILKFENLDLHGSDQHGNIFNFKRYFEKEYQCETSSISIENSFDLSIIPEFFKRFSFMYHTNFTVKFDWVKNGLDIDNIFKDATSKIRPSLYFKVKDFIVLLSVVEKNEEEGSGGYEEIDYAPRKSSSEEKEKKVITSSNSKVYVTITYPSDKLYEQINDELRFMEDYILNEKNKNYVHVLIKNSYGDYDFEPLDIKMPKMDLELNYGENFKKIYDKIVHKLSNNNKGLYMFHGEPGTGKSSFIKYLTKQVNKDFIFIPSSFIDKFISDPDIFSILLRKKKSVIILEDAEKIIISRDREENQNISTLLNISDGILSDILELSVILTYNCDDTKIDKALKRKGRTMVDYIFNKLSVDDSKKLAENLKFKEDQIEKIKEPMSLSEIYNMNEENKFYDDNELEDKNKIIGFGSLKA